MRNTKFVLLPFVVTFGLSLFAAAPALAESASASGPSTSSHGSVSLAVLDPACDTLGIELPVCFDSDPWER